MAKKIEQEHGGAINRFEKGDVGNPYGRPKNTETLIQDALNKARKGRTTIIIAHRMSTIKNADLIIVLDNEKKGIIEKGNHESLLSLNGKYRKLLEMQHRDIKI